jgi:hypothetical protein
MVAAAHLKPHLLPAQLTSCSINVHEGVEAPAQVFNKISPGSWLVEKRAHCLQLSMMEVASAHTLAPLCYGTAIEFGTKFSTTRHLCPMTTLVELRSHMLSKAPCSAFGQGLGCCSRAFAARSSGEFRKAIKLEVVCMANPRRVKMVAQQLKREISDMLLKDSVLQEAMMPERALGVDLSVSSVASITDVMLSNDLQVSGISWRRGLFASCSMFLMLWLNALGAWATFNGC